MQRDFMRLGKRYIIRKSTIENAVGMVGECVVEDSMTTWAAMQLISVPNPPPIGTTNVNGKLVNEPWKIGMIRKMHINDIVEELI